MMLCLTHSSCHQIQWWSACPAHPCQSSPEDIPGISLHLDRSWCFGCVASPGSQPACLHLGHAHPCIVLLCQVPTIFMKWLFEKRSFIPCWLILLLYVQRQRPFSTWRYPPPSWQCSPSCPPHPAAHGARISQHIQNPVQTSQGQLLKAFPPR